jgi:hypothetical protein
MCSWSCIYRVRTFVRVLASPWSVSVDMLSGWAQWLETSHNTCPVCKAHVTQSNVIPLYCRGEEPKDPRWLSRRHRLVCAPLSVTCDVGAVHGCVMQAATAHRPARFDTSV